MIQIKSKGIGKENPGMQIKINQWAILIIAMPRIKYIKEIA